MQFFTMAWWSGSEDNITSDPVNAYAVHLASIRDQLPPDLLKTQETVSLHDSRLRVLNLCDGTLKIELESYSGEERLMLIYTGVLKFESTSDPKVGLPGPSGYGDLGYTEVEILQSGCFEHRLLFSSGIELNVIFNGFSLERAKQEASVT